MVVVASEEMDVGMEIVDVGSDVIIGEIRGDVEGIKHVEEKVLGNKQIPRVWVSEEVFHRESNMHLLSFHFKIHLSYVVDDQKVHTRSQSQRMIKELTF